MRVVKSTGTGFGRLLRDWRRRRGHSQTDLAAELPLSQRHLSCLERGLARPGRDPALRLAEVLRMSAEATNGFLAAAGFAPAYPSRPLESAALQPVRKAIERILAAQDPNPALAVDRHWNLLAANTSLASLIADVDPAFLSPPTNVLRLSLHPDALAPAILNLREWRRHILHRLDGEIEKSGDSVLIELVAELKAYPLPPQVRPYRAPANDALAGLAIPLILQTKAGRMSFLSTTTVFGTATDITMAGVTIESFLPADDLTAQLLRSARS